MGQGLSSANPLTLNNLNFTQQIIEKDITALKSSTNANAPALIVKFNALNTDITTTLNDKSGISPEVLTAKQNSYNAQLIELNIEKKNILESSTTLGAVYVFKIITYSAGMLFAIIIISNTFYDKNIFYKIFYCIWGALLYPFVILYGVYSPPHWRAIFIPLIDMEDDSGWKSNILISPFIFLFKYTGPKGLDSLETVSKGKFALQLFSIVCLISFGITYVLV